MTGSPRMSCDHWAPATSVNNKMDKSRFLAGGVGSRTGGGGGGEIISAA